MCERAVLNAFIQDFFLSLASSCFSTPAKRRLSPLESAHGAPGSEKPEARIVVDREFSQALQISQCSQPLSRRIDVRSGLVRTMVDELTKVACQLAIARHGGNDGLVLDQIVQGQQSVPLEDRRGNHQTYYQNKGMHSLFKTKDVFPHTLSSTSLRSRGLPRRETGRLRLRRLLICATRERTRYSSPPKKTRPCERGLGQNTTLGW